jgi:hypothetical protein
MENTAQALQTKAELCRRLAQQASDVEVAHTLQETADDIEAAMRIIIDGGCADE